MSKVTEEQFLKHVADHVMTVIRDDGLFRHVRFSNPKSSNMFFDLVTWPEYLCFCGDMGTYVFQRTEDMFKFFHHESTDPDKKIYINPEYWGEKLESISKFGEGYKEFSKTRFEECVNDYANEYIENEVFTEKDYADTLREEIHYEIKDVEDESSAVNFIQNFVCDEFEFIDFFDGCNFEDFTYHYLWCCYAISWGVSKYYEEQQNTKPNSLNL